MPRPVTIPLRRRSGRGDGRVSQRAAPAGRAQPAEIEADKLPHGVEAETARHHRVRFEVTAVEPDIGMHIQLGDDLATAMAAAAVGDLDDAVEHQHGRQRQPGVTGPEQIAMAAFEQVFEVVAVLIGHFSRNSNGKNLVDSSAECQSRKAALMVAAAARLVQATGCRPAGAAQECL